VFDRTDVHLLVLNEQRRTSGLDHAEQCGTRTRTPDQTVRPLAAQHLLVEIRRERGGNGRHVERVDVGDPKITRRGVIVGHEIAGADVRGGFVDDEVLRVKDLIRGCPAHVDAPRAKRGERRGVLAAPFVVRVQEHAHVHPGLRARDQVANDDGVGQFVHREVNVVLGAVDRAVEESVTGRGFGPHSHDR